MTPEGTLLVLGGGGHAAVVIESAQAAGWTIAGFLDDRADARRPAMPSSPSHLGRVEDLPGVLATLPTPPLVHAAVGDPDLRRSWLGQVRALSAATIIHPSAVVSPTAHIGPGVFVGPRAVINARVRIDEGVIVNSGAVVEHDGELGAFCHVAPGAVLAGSVTVGPDTLIGVGATIAPGVRVGAAVTLGAGAVAASDIPDGVCAVGVPARSLRGQPQGTG